MASPSPSENPTVVTVEKGDTLSQIALDYLGSAKKYKQLATINKISNPNKIYIGQKIKLTSDSGSGSSTSSTTTANTSQVTITAFGLQSDTENTLFATWDWSKKNTDKYQVSWEYRTADDLWFVGNSSAISVDEFNPDASKQSTYNIPSNAKQVRFRVKPIAKTKSSSSKTVYWAANWSGYKYYTVSDFGAPDTPSGLQVEIDELKLTVSVDNLDEKITKVEFQVVKDNKTVTHSGKAATVNVETGHAAYTCTVDAGGEYKVRCRAYNSDGVAGEWSDYTDGKSTMPATPSIFYDPKADRVDKIDCVRLGWSISSTATGYEIEYTTNKAFFDRSNETTIISDVEFNYFTVTNLQTGKEYFFRVRAVNDAGKSKWTEIKSVIIGKAPAAPTTWASNSRVIVGEELILYWVHNAEDGSTQTYADLELIIDGERVLIPLIENDRPEDEQDKTSFYVVDTSEYEVGAKLQWRVRTAGVTKELGDWSIERVVDIYAKPTIELKVTDIDGNSIDELTSFPFMVYALAGPNTQMPIGYYLTVTANEIYETVDKIGNAVMVNKGERVYFKHFDTSDPLLVEMSAGNIDLENGISYTVTCTVAMNSGLTVEDSHEFTVSWIDTGYEPNGEITIDNETFVAHIRPYCESASITQYKVEYDGTKYTKTSEEVAWMYGDVIAEVYVDGSGEQVYLGVTPEDEEIYYCIVETAALVKDVSLSVYRREFDGSFTELATGIVNNRYTTITDPHPALDFARYRVVAITNDTGAVSYTDLAAQPVDGTAVVIQWDEAWSSFDTTEDAELEQPAWSGSMLKLPYNINVSDNYNPDVEFVSYIGRAHPIAYYGTQQGSTATWNMDIRKDDEETLYGLRRLAKWMGDVYVREPSGSGYWANVTVSFSQKHRTLTIPVTLNITRVEGGI